jgi:hypothetical protein
MLRGGLLKVDADCSTKIGLKSIKDLPATFDCLTSASVGIFASYLTHSPFELCCRDRKELLNKAHYKHRHIAGIFKIRNACGLENKSFRSIIE